MSGARIDVLHAGRGLACVTIAAVHANYYVPVADWIDLGRFSVHFFFILSGYVIYHSDAGRKFDLRRFALSRINRVYPPYLPVGVFAALCYVYLGREVDWLASLTLLPGETALIPAWTLQKEVVFYALAALFFASGRPLTCASIWAAAIVARSMSPAQMGEWEAAFLSPINLCFPVGMFLANFKVAPAIGTGRPLIFLGEASYSIYLVHLPVMGGLWRMGADFPTLVAGGITAGFAYHLWVERPMLSWIKHRSHRRVSTSLAFRQSRTPIQSSRPPLAID